MKKGPKANSPNIDPIIARPARFLCRAEIPPNRTISANISPIIPTTAIIPAKKSPMPPNNPEKPKMLPRKSMLIAVSIVDIASIIQMMPATTSSAPANNGIAVFCFGGAIIGIIGIIGG